MFTKEICLMQDSILAASVDGSYQTLYGRTCAGLFLQSLEGERFLFRHAASGLSLFYFLGTVKEAHKLQDSLSEGYDFARDSTWVLKGQSKLHELLIDLGLGRSWLHRAWHYAFKKAK